MANQYFIPDLGQIQEINQTQYMVPGFGFVDQSTTTSQEGTLEETITLTDSMTALARKLAGNTEALTLTDALSALGSFLAQAPETVQISVTFEVLASLLNQFNTNIVVDDDWLAVGAFLASLAETLTITDSFVGQRIFPPKINAESVTLTDSIFLEVIKAGVQQEGVTVSDLFGALYRGLGSIGEVVTVGADFTGLIIHRYLERHRFPLNVVNQHMSLKFQHNVSGKAFNLGDVAMRVIPYPVPWNNWYPWNLVAQHLKLKFRHNTAGESFDLHDVALRLIPYMEQ
jgi:hypothetical protein